MRVFCHRPVRRLLASAATVAALLVVPLQAAPGPAPAPALTPVADVQPAFPIRAAFYYGWYPWGLTTPGSHFHPTRGAYDTSDLNVLRAQVHEMTYAGMNAAMWSWWGRGSWADQRFPFALRAADGSAFRWAIYYELEGGKFPNPSVTKLRSDLSYLLATYGHDPNYLRVGGKPVIFVWTENDTCEAATRWAQGDPYHHWYVSLKVVGGYTGCGAQPAAWHQYAPAAPRSRIGSTSYAISPGFYDVHAATPRLGRSPSRWASDIAAMKASGARWQLVTTWNEFAEGTSVESAREWASWTGHGRYVDLLHAGLGSAPDVPAVPTGVTATSSSSGVRVSWSAVSGATSYRVLRDGCPVATVTGAAWTDATGAAGRPYDYSVQALNARGASVASGQAQGTAGSPSPPAPAASMDGERFVPATGQRLLDTRTGAGLACAGRRTGLVELRLPSTVPPDATAVALDVTVTGALGTGTATAWPTLGARPHTAPLQYASDRSRTDLVVVRVGAGRQVTLAMGAAPGHLVVDLAGWFVADPGTGGVLGAGTGERFADTRTGLGGVPVGAVRSMTVAMPSSVPPDATAVALTVMVSKAAAPGTATVYPGGTTAPALASLSYPASGIVSTTTVVGLGTGRTVSVALSQPGQVVLGVTGWWRRDAARSGVTLPTGVRVLDSRNGTGGVTVGRKLGVVNVQLPSVVPAGATVLLHVGALGASTYGAMSAYGAGGRKPAVATLDFGPAKGETAYAVVDLLPGSRVVSLDVSQPAYVYADLVGWSTA